MTRRDESEEVLDRATRRRLSYEKWRSANPTKPRDRMRTLRARRVVAEAARLTRPEVDAWREEQLGKLREAIAGTRKRLASHWAVDKF